ncbi:hypothetical protein BTO30_09395 [Domibacillus antri]|uniref:Iron permease n=1 Tax=Domibacillus antri TaxID=1714264 RepID=A0A1Q8Q583_9BACI|nr:FTR1 family protein [Domibacillus antri]OLN22510.1 hypothetical protein BTO30_09395 [Domibacillus antri]
MKRYFINLLFIMIIICTLIAASASANTNIDHLFVPVGDAIMKAKDGNLESVQENMTSFESEWRLINGHSESVEEAFKSVQQSLAEKNVNDVQKALSLLSEALVSYDEKLNPVDQSAELEKVRSLLPMIDEIRRLEVNEWTYQYLEKKWTSVEKIVRAESIASYGDIEAKMALLRIAVVKEPASPLEVSGALDALKMAVQQFLDGNTSAAPAKDSSLADYLALLKDAEEEARAGNSETAVIKLTEALLVWPAVEGSVQVKDTALYADVEIIIPEAAGILSSADGDAVKAADLIAGIAERIEPLTAATSYTWWDAALILLREGLEAVIIISALIAFLSKTGQRAAKKWIWIGAAAGIGASILMAVVLNQLFNGLSGAAGREYIEGFAGITAVVMMIGVGMWLHGKANVKKWNRLVNDSMAAAAASGSIVSFVAISFLSVFREGAETIIFYAGMAPNMSVSALLIGVFSAITVIMIFGLFMMKFSVKIPLRSFFISAALLIYVLAFKILGKSIHALQVAGAVEIHPTNIVPFIDEVGLYPTIETVVPQLLLLGLIAGTAIRMKKQKSLA